MARACSASSIGVHAYSREKTSALMDQFPLLHYILVRERAFPTFLRVLHQKNFLGQAPIRFSNTIPVKNDNSATYFLPIRADM